MIRRVPHPLPARRERERFGTPRGPKRVWLRHRKFVRSNHCIVLGCAAVDIEFAHIRSAANAGTGLKPHDRFGVRSVTTIMPSSTNAARGRSRTATASTSTRSPPSSCAARPMCRCASRCCSTKKQPAPALQHQVEQKHRMIDLCAGLPRFIPIYGTIR